MTAGSIPLPIPIPEDHLDEYIGNESVEACIVMTVLATVFLGLRFYSKLVLMRTSWGWEDTLLMGAYVFHEGLCIIGILSVRYAGVGYRTEWIELHKPWLLEVWAKYIIAFEFIHFGAVCLPKMAIVCFYLRMFQWRGRMFAAAAAVQLLLATVWFVSCVVAGLQCRPLAFWWDRTLPGGGTCIDITAFFRAQAVASPVLDCLVIALPVSTICGLRLAMRKRTELIFIFAVGSFGMIASIIRAEVFFMTSPLSDETWSSVALNKWSVIEVGTYIITACLPDLKPLLQRWSGKRAAAHASSIKLDNNRQNYSPAHMGISSPSTRTATFADDYLLTPPPSASMKSPGISRVAQDLPEDELKSPKTPISPAHARRWHVPRNSLRAWGVCEEGPVVVAMPETSMAREEIR